VHGNLLHTLPQLDSACSHRYARLSLFFLLLTELLRAHKLVQKEGKRLVWQGALRPTTSLHVRAEPWASRLAQYRPGDTVTLLVARRERLRRLAVTLTAAPPKS
jgi:hypothetical protein